MCCRLCKKDIKLETGTRTTLSQQEGNCEQLSLVFLHFLKWMITYQTKWVKCKHLTITEKFFKNGQSHNFYHSVFPSSLWQWIILPNDQCMSIFPTETQYWKHTKTCMTKQQTWARCPPSKGFLWIPPSHSVSQWDYQPEQTYSSGFI